LPKIQDGGLGDVIAMLETEVNSAILTMLFRCLHSVHAVETFLRLHDFIAERAVEVDGVACPSQNDAVAVT
jgi:hypothetical protein